MICYPYFKIPKTSQVNTLSQDEVTRDFYPLAQNAENRPMKHGFQTQDSRQLRTVTAKKGTVYGVSPVVVPKVSGSVPELKRRSSESGEATWLESEGQSPGMERSAEG